MEGKPPQDFGQFPPWKIKKHPNCLGCSQIKVFEKEHLFLLDLFVYRVALQMWIVFLLLDFFGLRLRVARRHVTGDRFVFLTRFGAL